MAKYAQRRKRYVGDNGALYENEWFSISISGVDGNGASYTRWYYAGNDGRIYQDGWYTINEKKYRFQSSGEMVTGWNGTDDESSLYYCGEDGARRYGWQWLKIPDDWSDDNDVATNILIITENMHVFISIRKVVRRNIVL